MRICVITSAAFPPEEGIGNFITNMSMEFLRKGHSVTVITRGKPGKTEVTDFQGIKLYKAPFLPLYPFHVQIHGIFAKRLIKSIEQDIDVVHYHTPLPPAIKVSPPVLTTVHTPMKTDTGKVELINPFSVAVKLQGKISCLIEKNLFRISDKITAVATSVSEELGEYGLNPKDVEVIGNGVDEKVFKPVSKKGNEKYLLYTGRLSYRKGLSDFIECGKIICHKYPDIKCKIVGKGPLMGNAVKMASDSGYKDRFEFLGHVDKNQLIQIYQNATIFIMPSHYEGLPTTLLEAMACGLPVVATAVSGNLDVVEDGKNGLLVPIKSPESMAAAVARLLDDEKLAIELGKAARRRIEERFTWDAISDKILKCYESILQEQPRK